MPGAYIQYRDSGGRIRRRDPWNKRERKLIEAANIQFFEVLLGRTLKKEDAEQICLDVSINVA